MQRLESKGAKFELGYWGIRGLGQPIRFLLAYTETPFSEVRLGLNQDSSPVEDESADWNALKPTLGLDFPNLPYLIDRSHAREVRITQSNAVMRYLARRFDLYGDNESDRIDIDVLQDEAYDYRNWIIKTTYTTEQNYPTTLAEFSNTAVPRYVDGFERYLESRQLSTHFVGKRISLVDFILYELIWQTTIMLPDSINATSRPRLHGFISEFKDIPQIKKYMARRDYIERPINSESAAFK